MQTKTGGISDEIARRKEQQAALAAERQGAQSRLEDLRQLMEDLAGDCRGREDLRRQLRVMIKQGRAPAWMTDYILFTDDPDEVVAFYRRKLQVL